MFIARRFKVNGFEELLYIKFASVGLLLRESRDKIHHKATYFRPQN